MNLRNKIRLIRMAFGVSLLLVLGLGFSSFFTYNQWQESKANNLKRNLYTFERTLEEVRTCLDAEVYDLAQLRLQEAIQLWKESRSIAKRNPKDQHAFEVIRKKYCAIWNDSEWNYRYKIRDKPTLQKEFDAICE